MRYFVVLCGVLLGIVVLAADSQAASKTRSATLLTPKRDDAVQRTQEIVGKLNTQGQPIVMVRPEADGAMWWMQPPVVMGERGHFRATVRFGSARSQEGDRFEICIGVLKTPQQAEFFKGKESLKELPEELLRSEPISVLLGPTNRPKPGPTSASIIKPRHGATVGRFEEMLGRADGDRDPVVLVRAAARGSHWWAQKPAARGTGGYFKAPVQIGNDKSKPGTSFYLLVVVPRSDSEASAFKPGASFSELPDGIPAAKSILVKLGDPSESGDDPPADPVGGSE